MTTSDNIVLDLIEAFRRSKTMFAAVELGIFDGARPAEYKELERLLPEKARQRVIIRDADHGMWFQQPEGCRKAVLEFLRGK